MNLSKFECKLLLVNSIISITVMMKKQILSYFRNQIEELSAHLQVAGFPESTEAVHDTRVCIKRIRAFVKLFKVKSKNKKIRKLQKKELNIIFRTAGKLRDLEMRKFLLNDYKKLLNENFPELENKIDVKIVERRKNLREILANGQRDFLLIYQQEVINEIESLEDEKMIDLIKNYLTKAIKRTGKNRYRIIPKVLHKQRMLLKEIRFCLEMSGDMVSEPDAEEQITKIKEMEDLLGSWHDYNILNRAVEKQMQKLKKPEVENVIKMNSLTHTISNDIILLLDKYRKSIPNLIITGL